MANSSDFAVRSIFPEDLEEEEHEFAELAASLIERVFRESHASEERRSTHWIEDFGWFLAEPAVEEVSHDEAFNERVVRPLIEMWDKNDGHAPGRFNGKLGTHLNVEMVRVGEHQGDYKLKIYGVDQV